MQFRIDPNPVTSVQDFPNYTDIYAKFCGTIKYTLNYIKGRKQANLITFTNPTTKLTISPANLYLLPICDGVLTENCSEFVTYDHTFFGEHTFELQVDLTPSFAYPDIPYPDFV